MAELHHKSIQHQPYSGLRLRTHARLHVDEVRRGRRNYQMRRANRRRKLDQQKGPDLDDVKKAVWAEELLEFRQKIFRNLATLAKELEDTDLLGKSCAAKIDELRKQNAEIEELHRKEAEVEELRKRKAKIEESRKENELALHLLTSRAKKPAGMRKYYAKPTQNLPIRGT